MKKLGLIGGMSWQSTLSYYRMLNEGIAERLGGQHSAELLMYSVDFQPLEQMQHTGDWEGIAENLSRAAQSLEAAGAEGLLLCTNSMHKVFDEIQDSIQVPMLHIAEATASALVKDQVKCAGLLGTAFTMEQDFYKRQLINHGLEVVVPDAEARGEVHRVIYEELCKGECLESSRVFYQETIQSLKSKGAEAVILGCTEIGLLIDRECSALPVYDTTALHVDAALNWCLGDG